MLIINLKKLILLHEKGEFEKENNTLLLSNSGIIALTIFQF